MRTTPVTYVRAVAVSVGLLTMWTGACAGSTDESSANVRSTTAPENTVAIPPDSVVDRTGETTVTISLIDNVFEPRFVEVSVGTQVVFANDGRNLHDVHPEFDRDFAATLDDLAPGGSHVVTFDRVGTFTYYCKLHGTAREGMNGAVIVVDE